MNWDNIVSTKRTGTESIEPGPRTNYQRDFDRLIFSSSFRRLQNKTQVFPLPGSAFVHNRLTHSLEVASVGRSIGKIVGDKLADINPMDREMELFYRYELSSVIASACLAHDIGNPAFGHSGEKAISNYFKENGGEKIESAKLSEYFDESQWSDLTNFEGNANAIRVLTHQFNGKSTGGLRLTYTTIASILKYPCESVATDKKIKHRSKYGFFQSEKVLVREICEATNMIREGSDPLIYKRHPFVYLTEAADDICYRIIDMEDAHRLGIIAGVEVEAHFLNLLSAIKRQGIEMDRIVRTLGKISDKNERISYLRAYCINVLTLQASDLFIEKSGEIIGGIFNNSLLDHIENEFKVLKDIADISYNEIYNHETVVEIEIAGYNVMSDLLKLFVPAVLKNDPKHKDEKILRLIPRQFEFKKEDTNYVKVLSVLDFVSGMTDPFATELYRKVFGIEIPKHK